MENRYHPLPIANVWTLPQDEYCGDNVIGDRDELAKTFINEAGYEIEEIIYLKITFWHFLVGSTITFLRHIFLRSRTVRVHYKPGIV